MVYVFDQCTGEWIIRDIAPDDPMPGTKRGKLRLRDFACHCRYNMVWSDTRALNALELLLLYAAPHTLRYAFRRIGEGVHIGQSAHYAGLAFHIGQDLGAKEQLRLIRLALDVCGFDRVEPPFITPGWVHVEKQVAPPASLSGGYPALGEGDRGVHVMILQDALCLNGCGVDALTGCYTGATARDVRRFQCVKQLKATGAVDAPTWRALMQPLTGRRRGRCQQDKKPPMRAVSVRYAACPEENEIRPLIKPLSSV